MGSLQKGEVGGVLLGSSLDGAFACVSSLLEGEKELTTGMFVLVDIFPVLPNCVD